MKIKYNTDKTSLAEHSLKVSLVPDAKRILHLSLGDRNLTQFGGIVLIHQLF